MDWYDLNFFICLVERQTLTASAEKLGVQHSTVSRRIERLESKLDIKLFNRLGKRYHLTQEGKHLYAQAVEVQKQIDTFERMACDQNALQGTVAISAPPVLVNEVLIKAIPAFRKRYPDIVLQLGGDLHISDLNRKEADIALRLKRPTQEDLIIRTIAHVRYGFFAHKDYVAHTPKDKWQLIEFNANKRLVKWLQSLVAQHDYTIGLSSNDLYITYSCICERLGIGILPYFLATKHSDLVPINLIDKQVMTADEVTSATQVYVIDYENEDESKNVIGTKVKPIPLVHSRSLYVVMHPDIRRSARVRVVAEWLGEVIGNLDRI